MKILFCTIILYHLYSYPACFLLFSSFLNIAKSRRELRITNKLMLLTKLSHKYDVHGLAPRNISKLR